MAQRDAAAAAQANFDDADIEEIDKELEEVSVESPVNIPRQIPLNNPIDHDEIHLAQNAEEEDKDQAIASQCYFSENCVKSRFLEAQPMRRQLLMIQMKIRRGQLEDLLGTDNLSASRRRMTLRLLWFIVGIIDHRLSFRRL